MAKRILWLSQHEIQPIQIPALQRMFGEDVEIIRDPKPFSDARDIADRYRRGKFDDMIVVAPLSVLDQLCRLGIKPLWSQMNQVEDPRQADFTYRGRHYRFEGFRRVLGLTIEFGYEGHEADRRPDD